MEVVWWGFLPAVGWPLVGQASCGVCMVVGTAPEQLCAVWTLCQPYPYLLQPCPMLGSKSLRSHL